MDRRVVWFFLNMFSFTTVYADYQVGALIALKNSLQDPTGALENWDSSNVNPCTWSHIICNGSDVIRVDLGDYGLSGTLVAELGNLKTLQYLKLFENQISGHIPKELGNLGNLVSLDLDHNNLTGPIPPELGKCGSLKFLRLQDNNLCGRIPVHELVEIDLRGGVNITQNPLLCTKFTIPPCPEKIECP